MRKWLKRIVIFLGLAVLGLVVVALLYPYWLPRVAGPVAKRFGATFEGFERRENGRFAIIGLVYTNRAVTVRATTVEGFWPHVWYRQKGGTNHELPFVAINGWKAIVQESPRTNGVPETERSVYGLYKEFERYIELGREWVPKATLLNGIVDVKGREYSLPLITWVNGELNADGVWPENAIPVEIKGRLAGEPYQMSYAMHPLDLRVRVQLFETNNAVETRLALFYRDNRVDGMAEFGPESGLLPQVASLRGADFKLPAELLKLEGYREVAGALVADWRTNRYTASLTARADPIKSDLPRIDVQVAAAGDTNSARIERLEATMPGLQMALSEPVEVSYEGKMLSGQSELAIDANLGELPWGNLEGEMNATVLLKPGERLPVFWVRARGTNVAGYQLRADTLTVSAKVDWPMVTEVEVDSRIESRAAAQIREGGSAEAGTPGVDPSLRDPASPHPQTIVQVRGGVNLQTRVLNETRLVVNGSLETKVLPVGISFASARVEARASGPLTNVQHGGEVELRRFVAPGLQPLNLEARWSALMVAFERLALRARSGPTELRASGTGYIDDQGTNFTFQELTLSNGDEHYLELAQPFELSVAEGFEIETDELQLKGSDRELRVEASLRWPAHGRVRLAARNVNPDLLQAFVTRSIRGLDVPELRLAAAWSNGPVAGFVQGDLALEEARFGQLQARIGAQIDEGGLSLTNLTVLDASGEVVRAAGFLPVSIHPAGTNGVVQLSRREEFDFRMATEPSPHFWGVIGELTRLEITNPAARVELHGTVRNPNGELDFRADRLALNQTNRELPALEKLSARVSLKAEELRIDRFDAAAEGQAFSVRGNVELGTNFWTQRREEIASYLVDQARLRLVAKEMEIAPFARYAPRYLAPRGTMAADLELLPSRKLGGNLTVRGVESRPIARVGVVQEIQADVRFDGTLVEIQDLGGVIGGERLTITGAVDIAQVHLSKGYPLVNLGIRGQNVPLARNPDVILRSDLNLRVQNGSNMVPVIAGEVTLQDSFLMRDIATLVPGRVASPERRPPYFTVPVEPVDAWTLDIRVRGVNFMRIRSPFFHGVASANFHVTRTLEEPMALGEAAISAGRIIFPFASLEVRQALVSLTSENPYVPRVFVTAGGRAFGFDLRMQVEGFADDPVIEFSSVPALTSEQIILMLTTGQIPRDDFGFSREDRAGKLAFFLGKSLWEKWNPGKAGEERLTIRSGQDITEQGRQTYEVEYQLSDRWSLVGEYDRFGALNANVKWRLFQR